MYTSLAAASETLRQMLQDAMESDIRVGGLAGIFIGATTVSLETPQEMTAAGRRGLSLWLYRISRDEHRLNEPPQIRTTAGRVEVIPTPLPLRLHYLVTPIAPGNPDTEQRILGRALQLFHAHPIVAGSLLRAELAGTEAELHVHLEALALEEITRVWEALEGSYQLAVSYEVSLVHIASAADPLPVELVESVRPDWAVIAEREVAV